ncbi:hypothetical protein BHM03_00031464, partial [Ensete ventricosum]
VQLGDAIDTLIWTAKHFSDAGEKTSRRRSLVRRRDRSQRDTDDELYSAMQLHKSFPFSSSLCFRASFLRTPVLEGWKQDKEMKRGVVVGAKEGLGAYVSSVEVDMHDRKSEMAKHADAFIALPGETSALFTRKDNTVMATLTNLNFLQVGLLNVDGYYDSLLHLFDTGVRQGFIEDSARHIVVSAETAAELLRKMEEIRVSRMPPAKRHRTTHLPSQAGLAQHVAVATPSPAPTAPVSPRCRAAVPPRDSAGPGGAHGGPYSPRPSSLTPLSLHVFLSDPRVEVWVATRASGPELGG